MFFGSELLNAASYDAESCAEIDITFDVNADLQLDVHYSGVSGVCEIEGETISSPPTVVFVYGGSWRSGEKETYQFVADFFTSNGFNIVIPDYRLFPEVAYPEFLKDIETFFHWLADNNDALKLNTDEVFVIGHSAGAYNLAMYLVNDDYQKPFRFEGFIGLAGPYDFFLPATEDKDYHAVFTQNGDFNNTDSLPAQLLPSDSLSHVLNKALILHGAGDSVVSTKNPKNILPGLRQSGIEANIKMYEGIGHVRLVSGLAIVPLLGFEIQQDVLKFLNGVTVVR